MTAQWIALKALTTLAPERRGMDPRLCTCLLAAAAVLRAALEAADCTRFRRAHPSWATACG
ncbi:hypothetical protein [Metallibacterium sp.]|uniref:hypothetical protein n=1 Tax=Metallibacterium sp. TaxID=2940281 RepID=UPI0026037D79|nr:hypothetical protein [Metallibacterium sp.]